MWDEQERFAKSATKLFTWLVAAIAALYVVEGLAAGASEFFVALLLVLPALAAVIAGYLLVSVIFGAALLGVACALGYVLDWLVHRPMKHPFGRWSGESLGE